MDSERVEELGKAFQMTERETQERRENMTEEEIIRYQKYIQQRQVQLEIFRLRTKELVEGLIKNVEFLEGKLKEIEGR